MVRRAMCQNVVNKVKTNTTCQKYNREQFFSRGEGLKLCSINVLSIIFYFQI